MKKLFVALLLLGALQAWAIDPLVFNNAAEEKRFNHLAAELRCLVCQNESLADSSAPLAQDLRREVKQLMDSGKTDAEIKAFLTDRYGDFVLYRPPFKSLTALLWIAPFVVLGFGVMLSLRALRARKTAAISDPDAPLLEARLRHEKENEL
jgi:cytochrome c-type biogenesis protein CcmH